MIIVLVEGRIADASRERFLEYAHHHAMMSREEEGCLAFDVYEDPTAPGTVRFVEEWRSAADLEAHRTTPHMKAFRSEALPLLEHSKVRQFEARELE